MTSCCASIFYTGLLCATFTLSANGKGFLVERKGSLRSTTDAGSFQKELRNAMGEAMGCGGHMAKEQLAAVEQVLKPTWQALPKNSKGRVERRFLRYLAYRYFHKQSSLVIRGFEPSRLLNASSWTTDDILSQRVPAYVESVLKSKHAHENGFDLQDAVLMVATIEQLVFDSESTLLEQVYKDQRKPLSRSLAQSGLEQVLEDYMIHWLLGDDQEGITIVMANKTLLSESIPHWEKIVSFANGQRKSMDFQRQHKPQSASRPGRNALSQRYSFDDAHQVVGDITKSFASFWESECASMKAQLVEMDRHHTGRVPLSKFYGSALDTDWRFGESESYLRELGALDETSSWYGKQVIIPNYLQAASNCIVSTRHYLVCCMNDCEGLMTEIEATVGSESASPAAILAIVSNMTSQTTLDHDDPPNIGASLTAQLEQIADGNGGKVLLHGRLFAQWLHYVFPRECPFPHKQGMAAALTPAEFGDSFIATQDEMQHHASTAKQADELASLGKEELQWMSQWSPEEELMDEQNVAPVAAQGSGLLAAGSAGLLLCGVLVAGLRLGRGSASAEGGLLPTHSKSHFV